jgi:two-component system, chemotaxis family, chemotaxis protein CheY
MAQDRTEAARRVLVVDDAALMRLYCRQALTAAGFEVEEAMNGVEALEKALDGAFDLLILDVNMPRMDGFSFLRALRRAPGKAATMPVLMLSTQAEPKDRAAARAAGANFYLVKPAAPAELCRCAAMLTGLPP